MWDVQLHDDFKREFDQFDERVQDAIVAGALLLQEFGPRLGRPHVDTLAGSRYPNMKELRISVAAEGVARRLRVRSGSGCDHPRGGEQVGPQQQLVLWNARSRG